ncbi:MAG TPA: tetratricopeptide repeat protein [Bryobacteraceae bacterium]|nr:tetratricopeptide repeat protein [Bryobacteraceae bacterium]
MTYLARFALAALATAGLMRSQTPEDGRVEALHGQAHAAEAAGDLAGAIGKYQEILRIEPRLAPAWNNLGALYFKQGRFREACDALERGLRLDPGMSSASALLGIALFQMADYQKARAPLEAAVKANPEDINAQFYLVNDLTRLAEFESAANHLRQILKAQPQNQHAWYLLGKVYMQLSQQALGRVNDIDPNSVWSHEVSAELMESMKNYDGAIVEWKKAIDAAPKQPGVHFKLGDLYWSLSQWDNAAEQFRLEQQIDPRNCMVDWKLGDILMRQNQEPEQALAREDKALAACPGLMEARSDRARLLLNLHREPEAITELREVEKTDPNEPGTHYLLAQAYRATGHSQQAQDEMKRFAELEAKARAATAERAQEVIRESQSAKQ